MKTERAFALMPAALASGLRRQGARRAAADPAKAKAWDRDVRDIESYRNERGVSDKGSALGPRPEDRFERTFHDHAQDRLRQARRRLDRVQQAERSMQRSREMGRGHDFGIGL